MSSKKMGNFLLRGLAGVSVLWLFSAVCLMASTGPSGPSGWALMAPAYADDNSTGGAGSDTGTMAPAAPEGIPIGPNDVLHVDVVGQSDLTGDYQVDAAGDITMPYIGKVHLGGLQVDQAAGPIASKLNTIYNNVTVTVSRHTVGGIGVTLTGALGRQGSVVVRRDSRLNDVLQQAGLATDADMAHVKITRGLPGTPQTNMTVDYASFLSAGVEDDNPPLKDGDVIYVPHKTPVTVSVSITGDVANPGRYDMAEGSTFFDLVSKAGGLSARADRTNIFIQPIGTLSHVSVNYDTASSNPGDSLANPVLADGDKVVVGELANQPTFSITGGVLNPGVKSLQGTVSLEDAIGDANGLQPHAHAADATVTRRTPSGAEVIKVNAADPKVAGDFMIQPDDNINIPPGNAPMQVNPFEVIGLLLTAFAIFH